MGRGLAERQGSASRNLFREVPELGLGRVVSGAGAGRGRSEHACDRRHVRPLRRPHQRVRTPQSMFRDPRRRSPISFRQKRTKSNEIGQIWTNLETAIGRHPDQSCWISLKKVGLAILSMARLAGCAGHASVHLHAIAAPVLGGPEVLRVVLSSQVYKNRQPNGSLDLT